ncbi:MAG TPA: C-GCAxxG-C-C family protein [Synergistales bacterium]|nr:C-GCAxxG-C-C family protein [Synergistales bacterium]
MGDLERAVMGWAQEGFCCSQIMILAGTALTGRDNRDLTAAMSGLCRGVYSGLGTCGALTGACCLLGFYVGKGTQGEEKDPGLVTMIEELYCWFRENWSGAGGGISCREILGDDLDAGMQQCFPLVLETLVKTIRLLEEHGVDVREGCPP